jgi:ABC-type polysaccharide/polyol phosphate transport system ATPase subunit
MNHLLNTNALELYNLSKIYKIYPSPMHRLKEIIFRKKLHTDFVALDNVSLTLKKGETFGIIGENGAGKSTLLKIVANTLKPTAGRIRRNGRISALLELGAGFNPELTGEENIFLNAYLLGLTKTEIEAKKQEIIDFSELWEFIKRPVKTYSSGMTVRLAFSVATTVDPDILIVDEALAVGDQHFQKKCIDRMMQFRKSGKTILFCSHALYLVQELCDRAVWLQNGKVTQCDETFRVINAYNDWVRAKDVGMKMSAPEPQAAHDEGKDKVAWIEQLEFTDGQGHAVEIVKTGQEIMLRMRIRIADHVQKYEGHIGLGVKRNDDLMMFGTTSKLDGLPPFRCQDKQELSIKFSSFSLLPGQYHFLVALGDEHALHPYDVQTTKNFAVEDPRGELGMVSLDHTWEYVYEKGEISD